MQHNFCGLFPVSTPDCVCLCENCGTPCNDTFGNGRCNECQTVCPDCGKTHKRIYLKDFALCDDCQDKAGNPPTNDFSKLDAQNSIHALAKIQSNEPQQ